MLQGPETDLREWKRCVDTQKNRKTYQKDIFLTCIETYFEDARQDEKHMPDPLESIMRPTDPVKEELRPILLKMIQFGSKIEKVRAQLFGFRKSRASPPESNASLLASKF